MPFGGKHGGSSTGDMFKAGPAVESVLPNAMLKKEYTLQTFSLAAHAAAAQGSVHSALVKANE